MRPQGLPLLTQKGALLITHQGMIILNFLEVKKVYKIRKIRDFKRLFGM